jgi:hypothetical protein
MLHKFFIGSLAKANKFSIGSFAKANKFSIGSLAKANKFSIGSFAKANKTTCVIAMALASAAIGAATATSAPEAKIEELNWLSGCWQVNGSEAGSIEQWSAPAGGSLIGMSRTIASGKTVFFEFLQIRAKGKSLVFIAQPGGEPPTEFVLTSKAKQQWRFSAIGHDFPQHVNYQRIDRNQLSAWIEGLENGKAKRVDFPMRRVACTN